MKCAYITYQKIVGIFRYMSKYDHYNGNRLCPINPVYPLHFKK